MLVEDRNNVKQIRLTVKSPAFNWKQIESDQNFFDNLGFSHLFFDDFLFPSSLIRTDKIGRSTRLPKSFCSHLKMDTAKRNKTGISGREVTTDEEIEPLSGRRRRVNLRQ